MVPGPKTEPIVSTECGAHRFDVGSRAHKPGYMLACMLKLALFVFSTGDCCFFLQSSTSCPLTSLFQRIALAQLARISRIQASLLQLIDDRVLQDRDSVAVDVVHGNAHHLAHLLHGLKKTYDSFHPDSGLELGDDGGHAAANKRK